MGHNWGIRSVGMNYSSTTESIPQTSPTTVNSLKKVSVYSTPWTVKNAALSPLITNSCVTGSLYCNARPSHPHMCEMNPGIYTGFAIRGVKTQQDGDLLPISPPQAPKELKYKVELLIWYLYQKGMGIINNMHVVNTDAPS